MFRELVLQHFSIVGEEEIRYYTLIDSDFQIDIESDDSTQDDVFMSLRIAKEYRHRNLNVAANIALFIRYWCGRDTNLYFYNIKLIEDPFVVEFRNKYSVDIKKYMLLM